MENGSNGGKVVCDVFMMVGGVVDRRREELSLFFKGEDRIGGSMMDDREGCWMVEKLQGRGSMAV